MTKYHYKRIDNRIEHSSSRYIEMITYSSIVLYGYRSTDSLLSK